ncbi:MAG: DUF2934 domain-containing protein [Proteobacteria bacterium]|nr:DUF2934 domain-containing protein [Pseudomonadota bacterium]
MAKRKVLDQEAIRERAYQLWLDRGQSHGSSLEDWVEAERLLLQQGWRRYGLKELEASRALGDEVEARGAPAG